MANIPFIRALVLAVALVSVRAFGCPLQSRVVRPERPPAEDQNKDHSCNQLRCLFAYFFYA